MSKRYKFFGREFEWYDIKTKLKKLMRGFLYLPASQYLISVVIFLYMNLVFFTSKRRFINLEAFANHDPNQAIILTFWHNRLMLIPFLARKIAKKINYNKKTLTLASKHGDGQFVGRVMERFSFVNIYGSSQNHRKASRGIDLGSLRFLIKKLREGYILGMTPDGPRGPNQQINSAIVDIAKMSRAKIVPISYSSSKFIEFNSWDRFKMPLPFSELVFVIDAEGFVIDEDENVARQNLAEKLDEVQERCDELVGR